MVPGGRRSAVADDVELESFWLFAAVSDDSGRTKGNSMQIDRHFLRRAKAFLIEFTAFVSLLLVLIKIIMTEAHQLFR